MLTKEENSKDKNRDWLNAVGAVGFILFAGPLVYPIFASAATALVHSTLPFSSSGSSDIDLYVTGLISFLGFMCLVFAAAVRFWEGYRENNSKHAPSLTAHDGTSAG
jgi:TRAP-type C4-dicarboxylate transport system permease small subunit